MIIALEPFFGDSQALQYSYLVLYAILLEQHYSEHARPWQEAQLLTMKDEDGNCQGQVV